MALLRVRAALTQVLGGAGSCTALQLLLADRLYLVT
jgi:hypothetical protein